MGKPQGKTSLGRPRRRRYSNIKINIKELDLGAWTGLIIARYVKWWALLNMVLALLVL